MSGREQVEPSARRWWLLVVLGTAQLMVVLDNTVVNVALPSAQQALGFDAGQRQWVVTSYAAAFGALLLLGGRLSERVGRRRALLVGLVGFAAASALGGAATGFGVLVAARVLQGAFGALLAPTVLTLLSTTFPRGPERTRAFGYLSSIIGAGAAIGLVLGGVLTEYLSWRATLFVNVGFAAVATVGAVVLLERDETADRTPIDLVGAGLAVLGVTGLVLGLGRAESASPASVQVLGPLVLGVLAVVAFLLRQRRVPNPLLPLRVLADRDRAAAFLARFTGSLGNFAVVFFTAALLQGPFGFSPLRTGLGIIPMVVGIVVSAQVVAPRVLPRLGYRVVVVGGLTISAAALLGLGQVGAGSSYGLGVALPLLVFGLGQGATTSTSTNTATANLDPGDTSVASAALSVFQQLGGSLGTALLAGVAAAAVTGGAAVGGAGAAYLVAAGLFAAAASGCVVLARRRPVPAAA